MNDICHVFIVFQFVVLKRATHLERSIKFLLIVETVFKLIMCTGNALKLPYFSCRKFASNLDTLDSLAGIEKTWCWLLSGVVNFGNSGIAVFNMLYSFCRYIVLPLCTKSEPIVIISVPIEGVYLKFQSLILYFCSCFWTSESCLLRWLFRPLHSGAKLHAVLPDSKNLEAGI